MRTIRTSVPILLTAAVFAVLVSGCSGGGDGVATAGGAPPASAAPNSEERTRRYVDCLREHGLDVPDPEPDARKIRLPDRDRPGVVDALRACQAFSPDVVGDPAAAAAAELAAARDYAACMRTNGLADFPDPDPDKGPVFPKEFATRPAFEAADRQCAHLVADTRPGGKG